MAETGLSLVVSKEMLSNLQKADALITNLATKSEQAKNRIVSAFTEMGQKGVGAFINKLHEAQSKIASLNSVKVQGIDFTQFTNSTTQAIDSVNKLTEAIGKVSKGSVAKPSEASNKTVFSRINEEVPQVIKNIHNVETVMGKILVGDKTYSNSALTKINAEIDTAMRKLGEVNKMLQFYAKGEGKKAIGFADTTSYQKEAKELMNIIDLLQRQRQSIIANSQLRIKVAQQQGAEANRYVAMENERRERIQANAKLESDLARKRTNDAKKNYEEQYKAYERMFDEIERRERKLAQQQAKNDSRMRKKDYERYVSTQDTYNHAMNVSGRAKTINQELRAIKSLELARANLSKTDAQYEQKLRNLNNAILQHKRNIEQATQGTKALQNSHRGLMNISDQLQRRLALVFSVSQITGYVQKLIQVRGEFELQQRSLQAIIQNRDEANKLWQQTVDLAVRSPFRVKELVTYTKQLAAYRIETEKLHDTTKMLSDVAAGLGVDMQRLILAFGQVKAANYLRGTELRQFSEAGINILGELATYFSELEGKAISVGEVFDMVSKRMVSFGDVEQVFKRLTSAGGTFYRMQEIQSNTLRGMISNLKDSIDLMLNDIGESSDSVLKKMVGATKSLVENWQVLAEMLKALVASFAMYKVNALLTSESVKLLAIDMGVLTKNIPKQLSLWQLLSTYALKAASSIKAASKAMLEFATKNWWVLALTAIIMAIREWVTWNDELNEQLDRLNNKRNEELSQINNLTRAYRELTKAQQKEGANSNAIFDEKVKKLRELQNLMGDAKFSIPLANQTLTPENIDAIFRNTEDLLNFARQWGYDLGKEVAVGLSDAEGWFHIFGDNLLTDLKDLDDASTQITGSMTYGLDKVVKQLQAAYPNLTKDAKDYLKAVEQGRRKDETEEAWLERKVTLLKNIYKSYKVAKPKELLDIETQLLRVAGQRKEVAKELNKVAKRMLKSYGVKDFSKLTSEQKVLLKTEIDKVFEQQQLSEQTKRFASHFLANKLKIPVELITPEETGNGLLDWQKRYNKFIKGLTTNSLSAVRDVTQTREALRKSIKEQVEQQQDIIDSYNVKGQQAFTEPEMQKATLAVKDLTQAYVWLGGALDDLNKKGEKKEQLKILNNRISLIKEINKEYEELNKTLGETEAKEQIIASYSDTFKEAFEGTGIDLSTIVIDNEKLKQLKESGQAAGSAFSDAMLAEMDKLAKEGAYIREFNEEAAKFTTFWEGKPILKAKDVEGQSKGYTIGYGEYGTYKDTNKVIQAGDTITQEQALERFTNLLYPKYRDELNNVLELNKDLIFTQDQYNALLDLTYQGGIGKVKDIIKYAKDENAALQHINNTQKEINETFGDMAVDRFGDAFINKFKQAENFYERVALLLETMNLMASDKKGNTFVSDILYEGMQARSDARAKLFSGSLELVNLLNEAAINVSDIDFTNIEGVIATLKQLQPLAEKEGKEAALALSREISRLEAKVGVQVKIKQDKVLLNEIENMFSGYQLSLELQKLNIPPNFAKEFFNIEALSLPELKDKLMELKPKFEGKDMIEKWDSLMKKLADMEVKSQEERLKTYLQYARDAVGERAKIKLEEMKKLQEIEETFTKPEQAEVKQKAIAKVKDDSLKAQQKLEWEEFQKSDTFVSLFSDLDSASSALINHSLEKLKEFKEQWKDMPLEDMKSIVGKINELEIALAKIKPFSGMKGLKESLQKMEKDSSFFSVDAQKLAKEGEYRKAFEMEIAYQEQRAKVAKREIGDLEAVISLKEEGREIDISSLDYSNNQQQLYALDLDMLREMLATQRGIVANSDEQISNSATYLNTQKQLQAKYLAQSDAISTANDMANQLYDSFKGLNNALGGEDSIGAIFADMGMQMLNTVFQTLALQAQLNAAAVAAEGLGVALNSTMGVIGWIVMGVNLIVQGLTAVFNAYDKRLSKQIETITRDVEDLDRALSKLEDRIDSAFSLSSASLHTKEAIKNLQSQIYSYERMIKLEKDKKKTDTDAIRQYENAIEDLKGKQLDLEKELVSTATSGILDSTRDAARQFVDAWYDAFAETGDGLQGLKDNFQEIMLDMVQQQATMTIAGNFLDRWKKQLDRYINPNDLKLTTEEAGNWVRSVQDELPMLNEALQQYFNAMEQAGVNLGKTTGDLSGLQAGIKNITEEQAAAIEAYLNSIRFFVAQNNTMLTTLVNSFTNSETPNPILSELRTQSEMIRAIRDMFSSVIGRGSANHSGAYLKVAL